MRTRTILAAAAVLAGVFASGCASRGNRKPEELVDRIHGTVAAVDACVTSRETAFDSMGALVAEPIEDLPARFETFKTDVDRVVSADGTLRGAVAAMMSAASARYRAWGRENQAYTDKDRKVRAEKSRAEAAEAFLKVAKDTDAMLEKSAGFVAGLSDLRKVLTTDLTPKGVAGVADFTAKARVSSGRLDEMALPIRNRLVAAADWVDSQPAPK
jgi:hypothetical protein